jgi:predicted phage terminase large subunit-like protein
MLKLWMAKNHLIDFISYSKSDYNVQWFHKTLCNHVDKLVSGEIKRLMVFMPPQHGKSEIVSRRAPAFLLGHNPDLKIAIASYSQGLATQFNRETQRIMEAEDYRLLFPNVRIGGVDIPRYLVMRTGSEFEVANRDGRVVSVGVGSGLTGRPVDIGIIDDPVKDAEQAYSQTYRNKVWDWYTTVFTTRLHNDSKIILTMTRWHEDDLAGRILKSAMETGEDWVILKFPAIKEGSPTAIDPRKDGEALWEGRHSRQKTLNVKSTSLKVYTSLYQQEPAPMEGHLIKTDWFNRFNLNELIARAINEDSEIVWNFTIDGAYTEKGENDATAIMAYAKYKGNLYIRNVSAVRLGMPELLKYIPDFCIANGYTSESRIKVEPKASGLSIVQMIRSQTELNIIADKPPRTDKIARVEKCTPFMESGRVFLLENAPWVEGYLYELKIFPNGEHDDQVDVTTMAIDSHIEEKEEYFDFDML